MNTMGSDPIVPVSMASPQAYGELAVVAVDAAPLARRGDAAPRHLGEIPFTVEEKRRRGMRKRGEARAGLARERGAHRDELVVRPHGHAEESLRGRGRRRPEVPSALSHVLDEPAVRAPSEDKRSLAGSKVPVAVRVAAERDLYAVGNRARQLHGDAERLDVVAPSVDDDVRRHLRVREEARRQCQHLNPLRRKGGESEQRHHQNRRVKLHVDILPYFFLYLFPFARLPRNMECRVERDAPCYRVRPLGLRLPSKRTSPFFGGYPSSNRTCRFPAYGSPCGTGFISFAPLRPSAPFHIDSDGCSSIWTSGFRRAAT